MMDVAANAHLVTQKPIGNGIRNDNDDNNDIYNKFNKNKNNNDNINDNSSGKNVKTIANSCVCKQCKQNSCCNSQTKHSNDISDLDEKQEVRLDKDIENGYYDTYTCTQTSPGTYQGKLPYFVDSSNSSGGKQKSWSMHPNIRSHTRVSDSHQNNHGEHDINEMTQDVTLLNINAQPKNNESL